MAEDIRAQIKTSAFVIAIYEAPDRAAADVEEALSPATRQIAELDGVVYLLAMEEPENLPAVDGTWSQVWTMGATDTTPAKVFDFLAGEGSRDVQLAFLLGMFAGRTLAAEFARVDLTAWTVADPSGMIDTAMAHDPTEDVITLKGGIAGAVVFGIPLRGVFGPVVDSTRPLLAQFLLELVSQAPFDGSTKIAVGLSETIDLASGTYMGAGVLWGGSANIWKPYAETSTANSVGASSAAVVAAHIVLPLLDRDGHQGGHESMLLDAGGSGVNRTSQNSLIDGTAAHAYVVFRRDGTAGDITVGIKIGSRILPQPLAYSVTGS